MATVSKFANANAVVTTGWTNPTNAYADDGSYATAAPAKNSTVSSDYGFPAFTTSDIPSGSTINSVTAEIQFKVSTTSSVATMGLQLNNNGTLLGSEQDNTSEPSGDTLLTHQVSSGISQSDLQSANHVKARVLGIRGNSNTAVTLSVDYVKLTVDYTVNNSAPNAPTLNSPADTATGVSTTPDLTFTGTDPDSDTIEYEVQVDTVNTFDGTVSASYSESNADNNDALGGGSVYGVAAIFIGDGKKLNKATFYLKKLGSPTGTVTANIYATSGTYGTDAAPTGSRLAISDSFDPSTLTTTSTLIDFVFSGSNQITLTNGTNYAVAIEYNHSDVNNNVRVGYDSTSTTYVGNEAQASTSGFVYTGDHLFTPAFYVYTGSPLLDKLSATPDATFTDVTNGADTHPFASGDQIKYTVQAGDTLSANTTYYWRVRGIDPSGSNTYGSWSSTRSFTTVSGSSDLSVNVSDSSAVTESVGRMVESYVNKSDSSAVTENVKSEVNSFVNVNDTSAVTESIKLEGNNRVSVSDSTTVTDTPTILLPFLNLSVSDSSNVTDSVRAEVNSFINASDSSGVTDSVSASIASTVNVSDSSGVTDSIKVEENNFINVSDTSGVTDSTSELIPTLFVSVSDSSAISEAILLMEPEGIAVLDSSAVTENVSLLIPTLFINVNDSSAVTENIKLLGEENISKSDSSAVTDSSSVLIPFFVPNVSDSSTVTESTKVEINDQINVSDSSGVTDSIKTEVNSFINVSDSPTVTDSQSVLIPTLLVNVSDSSTVSESILLLDTDGIGVTDNSGVTDSVSVLIPFLVPNVSDTSSVTDSIKMLAESNVSVSDTSAVTESLKEEVNSFINVSDASAVTDSISAAIGTVNDLSINVSDSTAVTESVSLLIPTLFLSVSDSSAISEALLMLDTEGIAVLDSTSVTENTGLVIPTLFISVSDSSGVTDSIKTEVNSFVNKSDSTGVTDSTSVFIPFLTPQVSDSSTVLEAVGLLETSFISATDNSTVTENTVVRSDENISVSESSAVTDSSAVSFDANVAVSDGSAITENVSVQEQAQSAYQINVSDAVAVTEFKKVQIAGSTTTTNSPQVIFLTDGRTAVRLANNLYLPL